MTAQSVLITGCSSGIGLASAKAMRSRGWRVFATARKPADLAMLQALGMEPVPLELRDATSVADCSRLVLERTGGKLDALFNNAAIGQPGAVEDLPVELLRESFEVNLFSWHALTRPILKQMRLNNSGRIVQCSSVLGLISPPWRAAYNSTKFALEALTDAMRHEVYGTNIRVSLIEPGPIATRFIDHSLANLRDRIDVEGSVHRDAYKIRLAAMAKGGKLTWKLQPEAVAGKLVHALTSKSPKHRYYVTLPTYMAVLGRRFLPHVIGERIVRNN